MIKKLLAKIFKKNTPELNVMGLETTTAVNAIIEEVEITVPEIFKEVVVSVNADIDNVQKKVTKSASSAASKTANKKPGRPKGSTSSKTAKKPGPKKS